MWTSMTFLVTCTIVKIIIMTETFQAILYISYIVLWFELWKDLCIICIIISQTKKTNNKLMNKLWWCHQYHLISFFFFVADQSDQWQIISSGGGDPHLLRRFSWVLLSSASSSSLLILVLPLPASRFWFPPLGRRPLDPGAAVVGRLRLAAVLQPVAPVAEALVLLQSQAAAGLHLRLQPEGRGHNCYLLLNSSHRHFDLTASCTDSRSKQCHWSQPCHW